MKKLLLGAVLFFGLSAGAYAQGLIDIGPGDLDPTHGVAGDWVQVTGSHTLSLNLDFILNVVEGLLGMEKNVYFGSVQATECEGLNDLLSLNLLVLKINPVSCRAPAGIAPGTTVPVDVRGGLSVSLFTNTPSFTYDYVAPAGVSISPVSGTPGTQVTISASTNLTGATVSFGTKPVTRCSRISDTQMSCHAPTPVNADDLVNVTVTTPAPGGGTVTATQQFQYVAAALPTISLSANHGYIAAPIVITASSAVPGAVVMFDDTVVSCSTNDDTVFTCPIPDGIGSNIEVALHDASHNEISEIVLFNYDIPALTSVTPQPSAPGASVTIEADQPISSQAIVLFGNTRAQGCVFDGVSTQGSCTVPPGSGDDVEVKLSDGGSFGAPALFDYKAPPPNITSISPPRAAVSTDITITAAAEVLSDTSVLFNGINIGVCKSVDGNTCTITVPAAGYKDLVEVKLLHDGVPSVNSGYVTVVTVPPAISGVSPNPPTGITGDKITITAAAPIQAGTKIYFDDTPADNCVVSGSTVTCDVPSGTDSADLTLRNEAGASTPYGTQFQYTSPTPDITNLSSNTGYISDEITVTVGSKPGAGVGIYFDDTEATCAPFPSTAPYTTTCTVPAGMGTADVTLFDGTNRSAATEFTYTVPNVESVTAPSAFISAVVSIEAFHEITADTIVLFGANEAQTCELTSPTTISCHVPDGSGTVEVKFSDGEGGLSATPGSFTYMIPSITGGLSKTEGNRGEVITITSHAIMAINTEVMFGEERADSCERLSAVELSCRVPDNIGLVDVALEDVDGTRGAGVAQFQYLVPEIDSIDPNPAFAGSQVEVTLALTDPAVVSTGTTVKFDGVASTCTVSGNATLTCDVPSGGSGSVDVVATDGTTDSTVPVTFTYAVLTPPTATGLSDTSGGISDTITITADGPIAAGTVAVFGDVEAVCSTISANTITCTVPDNVGAVDVALKNSGGVTGGTSGEFTYNIPALAGVSPSPSSVGQEVTITAEGGAIISSKTRVFFGAEEAAGCSFSGTTASGTCDVPTGAGTVDVRLFDGSAYGTGAAFKYALPGVTMVFPAQAIIGASVSVLVSGDPGSAEVYFGDAPATDCNPFTPSGGAGEYSTVCTTPDGMSFVDVYLSDGDGGTGASHSFEFVVPNVVSLSPTTGKIDTSVTIEATSKIVSANTVMFGATAATSCNIDDDTHVTCSAPEGVGEVSVTLYDGRVSGAGQNFTYAIPAITDIDPPSAVAGAPVTITADSIISSEARVFFGSTLASGCSFSGSSTIGTCNVPPGSGEDVAVALSDSDAGTSKGTPFLFDYITVSAVPSVTGLTPDVAKEGALVTVEVDGEIPADTHVLFDGVDIGVCAITGADTCTFNVPAGSGTAAVKLVNGGAESATGWTFTYNPMPDIVSLSPATGVAGDTVEIVYSGTMGGGMDFMFGEEEADCILLAPPNAECEVPEGTGTVSVTLSDGTYNGAGQNFTYTPTVPTPDPVITDVQPDYSIPGVVITGSNLNTTGLTVWFDGAEVTTCSFSDTQITCPKPAAEGEITVLVRDADGQEASMDVTYGVADPEITDAAQNENDELVITGSNLNGTGTTVSFNGTDATATCTFDSDTQITCPIPAGEEVDIKVTAIDGDYGEFRYLVDATSVTADPVITSAAADYNAGKIVISGSSLNTPGLKVEFNGSDVTGACALSDTQITCDKPAADGVVNIVLTDADGDTATATVNYLSLENRPDPTKDAVVRAMVGAQQSSAQRNIRAQFGNFSSRLSQIRGAAENRDSFRLSLGIKEAENDALYAYNPNTIDDLLAQNNINRASSSVEVSDITKVLMAPSSQKMNKAYGTWFTGTVRFGSEDALEDIDYTTYALSAGLDKVFSERMAGGVGFGYTGDKTDISANSSNLTSRAYSVAMYGTYALSSSVYIDGMLGYSFMAMDSERRTPSGLLATGTRVVNAVFGSVSTGYIYRNGGLTLSPYGRAQASWAGLKKYDESGADVENLIYGSSDVRMLVLAAGLESAYEFKQSWGSWIPRLSAEYLHNFDDASSMNIGYVDAGTTPYSFSGSVFSKDNVTMGAGMDFSLKTRWTISGDYKFTLGDHLQDNRVSAMVNYSF